MQPWAALALFVAVTGLVSALAFILIFAAGARIADALVRAFKEHRL